MRIIIAILIGLLSCPPMLFAGEGRRAFQPDWSIPLAHDIRPSIDRAGLGDGDFSSGRNSVAYGWVQESVVFGEAVVSANSESSFANDQSWFCISGKDYSAYADTGHKITLVDDAGLKAVAYVGAVGGGETFGSEIITAQNNRDFSSGNIGNWGVSADGAGTLTYNTDAIGGTDDKQALLTSSGDIFLYGSLTSPTYLTYATYTRYAVTAKIYIPAGNTLKDVRIYNKNLGTTYSKTATLSGDTWTTVTLDWLTGTDVAGYTRIGFNGNPADGDKLYFDDITITPMTDCPISGIHVTKTPGGSEGWEYDASFDFNNIEYVVISEEDPDGDLLVWYNNDKPRFEYAGGHWAYLGEPVGVNKCLYNRDLSQAGSWTDNLTSKAQTGTGIDGVANKAWACTDNNAGGTLEIEQSIAIAADTNVHCAYAFVEKDNDETRFPAVRMYMSGATVVHAAVMLNTKTGAVLGESDPLGYGCIDRGDTWQIWMTLANNNNTTLVAEFYPAYGTVLGTKSNTATGTAIMDWFQGEFDKKFPSSPIGPTLGSEVTRATEGGGYPRWSLPEDKLGTGNMFEEDLGGALIDGDMSDAGDWDEVGEGWVIAAGVATHSGTTNYSSIRQLVSIEEGKLYKHWMTITHTSGGGARFGVEDTDCPTTTAAYIKASGTYTRYWIATATNAIANVGARAHLNWEGTIEDMGFEEVTNAWDGMSPHGTIVMRWRPGYDVQSTGDYGSIINCRESETGLVAIRGNGNLYSYDATTNSVVALAHSANTWYKIVIQWGYLSSNVAKHRIGVDTGSGITWDATPEDFDGAFALGSYLKLNHGLDGPCHIRTIEGWRRILSDGEINNLKD